MSRPRQIGQRGSTLIEMVAVIAIIGILGGLSFEFLATGAETYGLIAGREQRHYDAWAALHRMERELRMAVPTAACPPAGGMPSAACVDAAGTSVTYGLNCADCEDRSATVSYAVSGGSLIRTGDVSGSHPAAHNVTGFFASKNGTLITITLTVENGAGGETISAVVSPLLEQNPGWSGLPGFTLNEVIR